MRRVGQKEVSYYLKNTWYVAAWADELGRQPLGRKLLGQDVAIYRKQDGRPVAIGNRCPHRFAPLSMGKLVGDCIECAYHGLQFDGAGNCVVNPHGDKAIPPRARVPSFCVEERNGLIWIWGGDPEAVDLDAIPDLDYLDDPETKTVSGSLHVEANYQLYIDNLMDLSHAQFAHGDQLGVRNYHNAELDVSEAEEKVRAVLRIPDSEVPPAIRSMTEQPDIKGNFILEANWQIPSIVTNHIQFLQGSGEVVFRSFGTHILTPETEHRAHYFYGLTRRHLLDDPNVDESVRAWHLRGFSEQDKPIIEAAARMMDGETDPVAMTRAPLPTDAGNVRARRILKKRIAAEAS